MKFKQIRNYAFNQLSETVIITRKQTSGLDSFGRPTSSYIQLASKEALLNQESKPTLTRTKDGQQEPLICSYYFKSENQPLIITDRFTTADQTTWEVYKLSSEPALGIVEAFCYEVKG